MNDFEYIKALTDIDDSFVAEAAGASYTAKSTHNRKIVLLVAAAMMSLMLVACSILVARSEVFTDKTPSADVEDRVEVLTEQTPENFNDVYLSRYTELLAEYGMSEEDIVVKTYQEYIRYGYYFDEVILVTKDTAVGRIITDAENFTFDVEFIGFFYNKRTDEFKTISEKTTAPGGRIEFIMNAEYGWECFGGILRRTHPESEYKGFFGIYMHKYGIEPSVRAMQYMDTYYDEMQKSQSPGPHPWNEIEDIATVKSDWVYGRDISIFAPTDSDDQLARIEQIASAFDMSGITNGTAFYDKQTVSDGQFIELGYAYDKDRFIAFMNNTIESTIIPDPIEPTIVEDWHISMVFYNDVNDQYRVIKRNYAEFTDYVLAIETEENWDFIGVYIYRSKPESDEYEFIDYYDFTPVEGDEADSQKFWERIRQEIEQDKNSTLQVRELRLRNKK